MVTETADDPLAPFAVLRTPSPSTAMFTPATHRRMRMLRMRAYCEEQQRQRLEAASCSAVTTDGRIFATPLEASLHLLWVIQRLSYYEPHREGQPADGPRIREVIRESRKLIDALGYEPGKPLPNAAPSRPEPME